jgi:uncharacterized phage protein (TIGR01671 family)
MRRRWRMREILFRGKANGGGCWVYGHYVVLNDGYRPDWKRHYILSGELRYNDQYGKEDIRKVEIDPKTLGQYTGLKDRNGRRIFEGDIVRYIYEPGKGFWNANQLSVIRYGKTGFKFDGIKGTNKYGLMCGCLSSIPFNQDAENIPEFEVIGNIHDNPELIPEMEEEMRRDG